MDEMGDTEEESEGHPLGHHHHQCCKKLVDEMGDTDGNQGVIHLCTTIIDAVKKLVEEMGNTEGESEGNPLVHHHHRCSGKTSGSNGRHRR